MLTNCCTKLHNSLKSNRTSLPLKLQSKPRGNNTSSYSKPVRFGPAFFVTLFGITHIYRIFVIFKYPKCR